MKTIIAGSRHFRNITFVFNMIEACPWKITEVISGDANGVDWLGAYWGYLQGLKVRHFPAKWEYFGKAAGSKRNQVMIDHGDALVAIWDGKSTGTKDIIERAARHRITSYIVSAIHGTQFVSY